MAGGAVVLTDRAKAVLRTGGGVAGETILIGKLRRSNRIAVRVVASGAF